MLMGSGDVFCLFSCCWLLVQCWQWLYQIFVCWLMVVCFSVWLQLGQGSLLWLYISSFCLKQFGVLLGLMKLCRVVLSWVMVQFRIFFIVLVSCWQCFCEIFFVLCNGLMLVLNRFLVVQMLFMFIIIVWFIRKVFIGVLWFWLWVNRQLLLNVLFSGFGFSFCSSGWIFLVGCQSRLLKWCGLLKCSRWLLFRLMLMWLCVCSGVLLGSMCRLLDMFRCSMVLLMVVFSSRYLVCWWMFLMCCFGSSLVIFGGIGQCRLVWCRIMLCIWWFCRCGVRSWWVVLILGSLGMG